MSHTDKNFPMEDSGADINPEEAVVISDATSDKEDDALENAESHKKSQEAGDGKNNSPAKINLSSIWPKVICLLAAVLVWFYVSGEQSISFEREFSNIPLTFDGVSFLEKQGYTIIAGNEAVINVTVRGTRSDVNRIKLDDIIAKCDVSNIYEPGEFTLSVFCDSPGSTTVSGVSPSSVIIYVDKSIQKTIPVVAEVTTGGTTEMSVKIETPEPSIENVKVTGPEEEIAKISHAAIDVVLDGLIDKSTEWKGGLYLVDKNGQRYSNAYVKLDRTNVRVFVPVNKYKTVPIKVIYDGPNALELGHDVNLSVGSVEIRGSKDVVDSISTIETELVDISDIRRETTISAALNVPQGVEITEGHPTTVDIKVVPHNNNKKTIVTSNVVMINVPEGRTAKLSESYVSVDFFGTAEAVAGLSPKNVYAVANLASCDGPGVYDVALTLNYPGIEDVGFTAGKVYTVKVTIS